MNAVTLSILMLYVIYFWRKNVIRPDFIFTVSVLGSFFVAGLHLSLYQSYYKLEFYFLVYFLVFLFDAFYLLTRGRGNSIGRQGCQECDYGYGNAIKILVFGTSALMVSSVFVMWVVLGAPPAISMTNHRELYWIPVIGNGYLLGTVCFSLLLFDRFTLRKISNRNFFIGISVVVVCTLLMANKFQIFTLILIYFFLKSLLSKSKSFLFFAGLCGCIVVIFAVMYEVFYTNMYNFSTQDANYWYGVNLPEYLNFLVYPYLYIATNWDNLYNFMTSPIHHLFGAGIFFNITRSEFLSNIIFGDSILRYLVEYDDSLQIGKMNTATTFFLPYRDFGITGMCLYSIVIGMISGIVERYYKSNKSFFSLSLYLYVLVAVSFSFFNENFTSKVLLISLPVAYVCSLVLDRKIKIVMNKKYY